MDRKSIERLVVVSAVVHYVPTLRDDPDDELLLTDTEIALDGGLDSYFREKIIERLRSKGLEIVADPDRNPNVPGAVAAVHAGQLSLVDASQAIARHLDDVQSQKVNSSGLLAVVQGHVNTQPCLAILKLERERGVRFMISRSADGGNTVDLELLRNLTMTDKTRVFKTALLAPDHGSLSGLVADDQRGSATNGLRVADFFLGDFLGCQPKLPGAKITFDFVRASNEIFNSAVQSPEIQGQYQVGLLSELQSNVRDIKPSDFAHRHLKPEHRDVFLEHVARAGIDPQAPFQKDTTLISMSRFKMTFRSGMILVGSERALRNNVRLPRDNGSGEPVVLEDSIDALIGGR